MGRMLYQNNIQYRTSEEDMSLLGIVVVGETDPTAAMAKALSAMNEKYPDFMCQKMKLQDYVREGRDIVVNYRHVI